MARTNSTSTETPIKLSPAMGLYEIPAGTNKHDIQEFLISRLTQLHALLEITYGNGAEVFQNWSSDIQDNYMWGCASLAEECRQLAEAC